MAEGGAVDEVDDLCDARMKASWVSFASFVAREVEGIWGDSDGLFIVRDRNGPECAASGFVLIGLELSLECHGVQGTVAGTIGLGACEEALARVIGVNAVLAVVQLFERVGAGRGDESLGNGEGDTAIEKRDLIFVDIDLICGAAGALGAKAFGVTGVGNAEERVVVDLNVVDADHVFPIISGVMKRLRRLVQTGKCILCTHLHPLPKRG